ncbi:nitroreductase family protein [Paenibacillus solisilvae]|uniref:Nitroreductase family protein n=1 Tax=Paenibacillus solisilvae TaxID=2486751 RepID=A0ABW0VVS3_9BACL
MSTKLPFQSDQSSANDKHAEEIKQHRNPDHPVSPLFINRWSPRSYTNQPVTDEVLYTVLEAARWAPSSSNLQPWQFIIAREAAEHELFQQFILPGNRIWTDHVPVLILVASKKLREDGEPNGAHAFDTGAAWATLALQAHLLGLSTRAVGGFDRSKAREVLDIPDHIELHAIIGLGYRGGIDTLDERFHETIISVVVIENSSTILQTRALIGRLSQSAMRELASKALELDSPDEIRSSIEAKVPEILDL